MVKKAGLFLVLIMSFALTLFAGDGMSADEEIKKMENTFGPLIGASYLRRSHAQTLFEKIKNKDPLSGADLDQFHLMITDYLKVKGRLEEVANKYSDLVHEEGNISRDKRLELVMISLCAMLIQYDDYLTTYMHYADHDKLRRLFDKPDTAYDIPEDVLKEMTDAYYAKSRRDTVRDMIAFYDENIASAAGEHNGFFNILREYIDNSPSYQQGFEYDKEYLEDNLKKTYDSTLDTGNEGREETTYRLSQGFGDTVGLVATRKGKLYGDAAVADHIRSVIRAGDILLEKTPFRLTDKLIPGYWGHAAVYVGTEAELKELGIWNHPDVVPFHESIRQGRLIMEALRDEGVQLNTIEHFLNVDDLAVMHDLTESDSDKAYRLLLLFRQFGKAYDFNFDIEVTEKIFCSELVYITSIKIDWQTSESAGKATFNPDDAAWRSVDESTMFDIAVLYHDGKEVAENKKEVMRRLLEEE